MCTAVNFSNKILYGTFFRLILSFKITASKTSPPDTHYVKYNRDSTATNALAKDFKAKFAPRDMASLEECLRQSAEATKDLGS